MEVCSRTFSESSARQYSQSPKVTPNGNFGQMNFVSIFLDFRLITFNSMTSKPKDLKYLLLIRSLDLELNQQKYHNITQCERDHLRGVVSNHRAS